MTRPFFDLQGLADVINLPYGTAPPAGAVVASFSVRVSSTIPTKSACPGSAGHALLLNNINECYATNAFMEGCDFKVTATGKVVSFEDLAPGCVWGSCLSGPFQTAFGNAANLCPAGRGKAPGFDASVCHSCTAASDFNIHGPWYGETTNGWSCNKYAPPPTTGRFLPTPVYCTCST